MDVFSSTRKMGCSAAKLTLSFYTVTSPTFAVQSQNKLASVPGSPTLKAKQRKSFTELFLIPMFTTILIASSRRDLFIDMVDNNQVTLFPCFTFISKTGYNIKEDSFYYEDLPSDIFLLDSFLTNRKF